MNYYEKEPYLGFLSVKAPETQLSYIKVFKLVREYSGKEVYECSSDQLKSYFLSCESRGMKKTTMGTYKACLSSFFHHLTIDKKNPFHIKADDNPMIIVSAEINTQNRDKTKRMALTPKQRKAVYDCLIWEGPRCTLHEYQISLAIWFGFKIGLRRFEIAKARKEDFDFEKKTYTVVGKRSKKVTNPLHPSIIEKLKTYYSLLDASHIDSPWIFCNFSDPSKHYLKFSIASWFKVIKERAGLGDDVLFSSHDGRRGFVTALHDAGIPPSTGMKLSRHDGFDTYNKYVRVDDKEKADALDKAID